MTCFSALTSRREKVDSEPVPFDSPANFAERQHAEESFGRLDAGHPRRDAGIVVPLPKFGKNAGVEQVGHQSAILRGSPPDRGNPMESPCGMLRR